MAQAQTQDLTYDDPYVQDLSILISESKIKLYSKSTPSKLDIIKEHLDARDNDDGFYLVDLYEIVEQYKLWLKELPRVKVFYAVKCNPNPAILQTLALLGCGFDVASKSEIKAVLDLNVSTSQLLYANPMKDPDSLRYARSNNVNVLTVDCVEEIEKIKEHYPEAKLVLRIKADDCKSLFQFSIKFGCSVKEAKVCLKRAKELDLDVIGVSFHVGSKCHDQNAFKSAFCDAREVFSVAESMGMKLTLLDIGGGFPGVEGETEASFVQQASVINESIDLYFRDVPDLQIVAEPGRFFATKPYTVVMNVIGKKKKVNEENGVTHFQYYLNDGIYSSFNIITYEGVKPEIKLVNETNPQRYRSTVFGPTCDSLDLILKDVELPEMNIGDWCYVEDFGAYTHALHSSFNGFAALECKYIVRC